MHFIQSHLSRLFPTTHFSSRLPQISRRLPIAADMGGGSNSNHPRNNRNPPNTVGHSNAGNEKWMPREARKVVPKDQKPSVNPKGDYDNDYPPLGLGTGPSYKSKMKPKVDLGNNDDHRLEKRSMTASSLQPEASPAGNQTNKEDEAMSESLPTNQAKNSSDSPTKRHKSHQPYPEDSVILDSDKSLSSPKPFDESRMPVMAKAVNIPQPVMEKAKHAVEQEASPVGNQTIKEDEASLPTSFGKKQKDFSARTSKIPQNSFGDSGKSYSSKTLSSPEPFDICYPEKQEQAWHVLRPGMVLLKNYISLYDQVQIVKKCQELGKGPGGFYQPGYDDGAKLRLQMMCLGQDWDPRSRTYGKERAFDGSKPPAIPTEFELLVKRAVHDSQALIEKDAASHNVEYILPSISPDICIVNFYAANGRLGLHQDRDESKESLRKGLPVVSFSIGDSAEFLYGDWRDTESAERVILHSGDVLVFGGKSRHVFHGVSHIVRKTGPRALWEVTGLKPGRLNLTFRQY